jgi:hypothetical protein
MAESESTVYRRVENPCVGGSIPPRATKNHNSPLVGLFFFSLSKVVDGSNTLGQRLNLN